MKDSVFGILLPCLVVCLSLPVHSGHAQSPNANSHSVTPYDFHIIKNYLTLQDHSNELTKQKTFDLVDSISKISYFYGSNQLGYETIGLLDLRGRYIEYYFNQQSLQSSGNEPNCAIVMTSYFGESSNKRYMQHFISVLNNIKLFLLSRELFAALFREMLVAGGREGAAFLFEGSLISIHQNSSDLRTISVTPAPGTTSNPTYSYRVEERIGKRKIQIRWQYLVAEEEQLSDDYFFAHYSDLLVAVKKNNLQKMQPSVRGN